jgi:holo-[acyl-carrier protein] synthase
MRVIGIGLDVVNISRVRRMAGRDEAVFIRRILGPSERELSAVLRSTRARWVVYARAIAAKEAFFKALGTGLIGAMRWTDVELVGRRQCPQLQVSGAAEREMTARGVTGSMISVAATARVAVAAVTLMRT